MTAGSATLKEAVNEALRDWAASVRTTHYIIGSVVGPHPFPGLVRDLQRVIGDEARAQFADRLGGDPAYVVACVGGGSNAIGMFTAFVGAPGVQLIGVEAGGRGSRARRALPVADAGPARRPARRAQLPAAGRGRAGRRHALDLRGPRLPGRRARARVPQGRGARRLRQRHRRRRARGVPGPGAHRGHPAGARAGARDRVAPAPPAPRGRAGARLPLRPGRQGPRHGPWRRWSGLRCADARGGAPRGRDAGRKAFVPYVTGGYPGVDAAAPRDSQDAGADAVEVGIPHSDPVMDGGVIQQASAGARGRRARPGTCSPRSPRPASTSRSPS